MKTVVLFLKHSEIQRMALIFLPMILSLIMWHTIRLSYNFGAIAWGIPSDDFILNYTDLPYALSLITGVMVYLVSFLFTGKNKFSRA